jgi:hypothetical protein
MKCTVLLHCNMRAYTGCVLYALSQGTPPFAGGSLSEVIGRVLNEQPQGLQQLQGDLSQLVTWLLQKVTPHTLFSNFILLLFEHYVQFEHQCSIMRLHA